MGQGRGDKAAGGGAMRKGANCSRSFSAFEARLSMILLMLLPRDYGVTLPMPTVAQGIQQLPAHDGQLRLYGCLMLCHSVFTWIQIYSRSYFSKEELSVKESMFRSKTSKVAL